MKIDSEIHGRKDTAHCKRVRPTGANGQLVLNCWVTSRRDKTCIRKQDNILYLGKHAKVWWYKARINGFFEENRMLQLEIDGRLVISYKAQKEKYLLSKKNHDYLPTVLFMIFFLLSLTMQANFRMKPA